MTLLKRSHRHYVLIGIAGLLLIPIAMAAFAPLLAPIPSQAAGWTAPPLPQRDELLPDFQHLLDPLPLVVRDLPDAPSGEVVAIYDTSTLSNTQALDGLVTAAEEAIPIPPDLQRGWNDWIRYANDPGGEERPVPFYVLEALRVDPRNGDRLSNLAVALYFRGLEPEAVSRPALELLRTTVQVFPDSRGAVLNYMFLRAGPGLSLEPESSAVFDAWLMAHPGDTTAVQLAVYLYTEGSHWNYDPSPDVLETFAKELSENPDAPTAALGHALLGDIDLAAAVSQSEFAPYSARQYALSALLDYDEALKLSDDPSIYAARSATLEFLGEVKAAIMTQQRAVDTGPESVTLRLRLASLYLEQRGSEADIREAVSVARTINRDTFDIAFAHLEIPLDEVQVRTGTTNTDVVGYAASRPERSYFFPNRYGGMAGGGYAISFTLIPVEPPKWGMETDNIPAVRASFRAVADSVILGDPDGAAEDLERLRRVYADPRWVWDMPTYSVTPNSLQSALPAARMVADPSTSDDSYAVNFAARQLRMAGMNEQAVELCLAAGDEEMCVAENAYLAGDFETSQQAFEAIGDDLMVGYVAERRGDQDEAIRRYRLVAESNSDYRYIAMLRLADALLDSGDPLGASTYYDELISWIGTNEHGVFNMASLPVEVMLPLAQSNRGIARLQMQAGSDARINCEGEAWDACTAAYLDFGAALEIDPYNPVFLMNQAWAARLLDDSELSEQLMNNALEADISIYPVLNDLGVFAAESGDTSAASQYFLDAAAANPRYDLALWNLGVLNMQKGISGIFRGQAYLARAIVQNPSLVTGSMDFRTDERVYRVEINERLRPGAGWSFGAAASVATIGFGLVTMVLALAHATYLVVLDKLLEKLNSTVAMRARWIRQRFPLRSPLPLNDRWSRWLPVAIGLAVLAVATTWIARQGDPHAASASAALALFAAVLAVVTHELGHALAARRLKATTQPAQWMPGTVLALGLFPFGVSAGPYPGQKVVAKSEAVSKWVYMAGPLANLAVAIIAYLLFTMQPVPGLRQISEVQLAAMGYALLPFAPLDGAVLAPAHPRLMSVVGGALLLVGVLFTIGFL